MRGGIYTREVYQGAAILGELGAESVEGGKPEARIRNQSIPGMQT
jgi:hypothetical protein